jgi:hypothetical protein
VPSKSGSSGSKEARRPVLEPSLVRRLHEQLVRVLGARGAVGVSVPRRQLGRDRRRHPNGDRRFLLTFVLAALFWWWSSYMLLYRRVPLRQMFPAGVATGCCITALGIVSALVFSDQLTSGQKSYGPAGVVIALITFLVGFGVCLPRRRGLRPNVERTAS